MKGFNLRIINIYLLYIAIIPMVIVNNFFVAAPKFNPGDVVEMKNEKKKKYKIIHVTKKINFFFSEEFLYKSRDINTLEIWDDLPENSFQKLTDNELKDLISQLEPKQRENLSKIEN